MAIFHVTPEKSVFIVDASFTDAFNSDTTSPDTLIVDPGAFLIAANFGNGASLAPTNAWTVTVNGSIVSTIGVGIVVDSLNAAVSTIKIGVDGEVQGFDGIILGSAANINNAGTINSTAAGGIGIRISGGADTITNSGEITAAFAAIEVTNTSNDTVHNSGIINGAIGLSAGNDTVTNSGVLSNGDLSLGDGTNHLINSGVISDDVVGGSGADTVTNSHLINGFVLLGDGNNTLVNSGTINGEVHGGSGPDTVTDFAIVGDVIKSGTITGLISLGDGDDKFSGGANAEKVQDGNGADTMAFGGGNDTYIATGNTGADGIDIVKGGAGVDTYDASAAITGMGINLDTAAHDFGPFTPGSGLVAANTATGSEIGKDTIFGFENVNGSAGNDSIFGSAAGNVLNGGDGQDFMFGFGGNDTLDGGNGNDHLVGGPGKDHLTGGAGADVFDYTALSDSGITAATRDLVADFQQGSDLIDLHLIDANTKNAAGTNDAFTFVGTNVTTGFNSSPGQLHAYWTAAGQIVEGDVNGDKKADFSIEIADPLHAITLTSADFIL